MKIICLLALLLPFMVSAQEYRGFEAAAKVEGASFVWYKTNSQLPDYVSFLADYELPSDNFTLWLSKHFGFSGSFSLSLISTEVDRLGMVHNRYRQRWNGIDVENGTVVTHEKNGYIRSWNGALQQLPESIGRGSDISAEVALNKALAFVNATEYRWQNDFWEQQIKNINNNQSASWFPKAESVLVLVDNTWQMAWRFDIYAQVPLSRQYVYVAVTDGSVIKVVNRLRNTDVPGTAITKYSGTQTITTDSMSVSSFRLRETGRGLGIETYDLNNNTYSASAVDFTDSDNIWNNVNVQQDEVSTDAHWGAEMTYDYYFLRYGRNSLDNAGKKLISYVHYDSDWANAMWDGTAMYYGDGDAGQGITPLTTLDICGHEVSHGLTEYTANLIYAGEPGALNESFSDIFGISIRYFAKPLDFSWQMGEEMGWVIRDMSNPNAYGQPDTYLGYMWDIMQEVHTNSGVMNYWFYLLSVGGSGINDNGDFYTVSPISIDSASAIAYRTLTTYLIETSEYDDVRFYSIIAAADLFGSCSPEVIATTNAWYAVGVGAPFNPTVTADFYSNDSLGCSAPHIVNFENQSATATTFYWDFGDGGTSTAIFPSHTYNALGSYTVTLIADGGSCGKDTTEKVQYIDIDSDNPCVITLPFSGVAPTQTSCSGILMDSGGDDNYPDNSTSTITISPVGAQQVILLFTEFALEEDWDYLKIYDGPGVGSPVIGNFTGFSLPNGGTIASTGSSITLRFTSDTYINESGFRLNWECVVDGVGYEQLENPVVVYPNPAEDMLTIQLNEKFQGNVAYSIMDVTGNTIISGMQSNTSQLIKLPVSQLASGYYYLVLLSDTQTISLPFVKQ